MYLTARAFNGCRPGLDSTRHRLFALRALYREERIQEVIGYGIEVFSVDSVAFLALGWLK